MMKIEVIAAVAFVAASVSPAMAIQRQQTMTRSCAEVQALVQQQGAVILQYSSPGRSGPPLYDRAVADSDKCFGSGYGARDYVPARDRRDCAVWVCRPNTDLRP
jgi:hypothetical protein